MFLDELRSRTATAHQSLEETAYAKTLLSAEVTSTDYARYLSVLHPFVAGFEQYVFPLLRGAIPDLEERRKSHLLQNDLRQLSVLPPNENHDRLLDFFQQYDNAAKAMGGMYVLEGSVLGGKMITHHLIKHLGAAAAGYTTYMTAYGAQTGTKWKGFLEALNLFAADNDRQAIIESAAATFHQLKILFTSASFNFSTHGHPQHR